MRIVILAGDDVGAEVADRPVEEAVARADGDPVGQPHAVGGLPSDVVHYLPQQSLLPLHAVDAAVAPDAVEAADGLKGCRRQRPRHACSSSGTC